MACTFTIESLFVRRFYNYNYNFISIKITSKFLIVVYKSECLCVLLRNFFNPLVWFIKTGLRICATCWGVLIVVSQFMSQRDLFFFKGMEYLLGELVTVKSEMPSSQKADLELTQYEWEPQANLEKSPVEWWRESSGKCFHIYRLACEYLCVPVCVRSHLQQTLTPSATLQAINSQLAVKIKFLNTNYTPSD